LYVIYAVNIFVDVLVLKEASANCTDLLHETEVRWLSSGRALQSFVALGDETVQLQESYVEKFTKLHDQKRNNGMYFLCDILSHLSERNLELLSKCPLVWYGNSSEILQNELQLFKVTL
jgi:hypothetical protein